MREILFRGKRIDNGEWVEGYLYEHEPPLQCVVPNGYIPEKSKWYILKTAFADWNMPRQVEFIEVDFSTVGQYTGLKDKNGKRIFEGDIWSYLGYNGVIRWSQEDCAFVAAYTIGGIEYECAVTEHKAKQFEVIGNIHDNPELIGGTE